MLLKLLHRKLLVGGAITILKNISQWEGLSHILWKIKNMFQTTNQINTQLLPMKQL